MCGLVKSGEKVEGGLMEKKMDKLNNIKVDWKEHLFAEIDWKKRNDGEKMQRRTREVDDFEILKLGWRMDKRNENGIDGLLSK